MLYAELGCAIVNVELGGGLLSQGAQDVGRLKCWRACFRVLCQVQNTVMPSQTFCMQDSSGKHLEVGPVGAAAATARAAHFIPLADAATSLASSQETLSRFLKAAVAARDPVLIHLIFKTLISNGCGKALIDAYPDSMELEYHLLALGAPRPYVIPRSEIHKYQVRRCIFNCDSSTWHSLVASSLVPQQVMVRPCHVHIADVTPGAT